MEVLVLAMNGSGTSRLEAIVSALETSETPLELLTRVPCLPVQLQDFQLLVSRKRLSCDEVVSMVTEYPSNGSASGRPDSALASPCSSDDMALLQRKLSKRNKKIKALTDQVSSLGSQLQDAEAKAQQLELEQRQFLEDVQDMQDQFEKLSESHRKLLWEYLPGRDAGMRAIPEMATEIVETPTAIGKYPLHQVLGYGQYAVVYSSSTSEQPELAIKAIDKQKLVDLVSLHRINSEISSLRDPAIQQAGILALRDVIHTRDHIYLVTERGGKDLFEIFGAHLDGLSEETIRPLMLHVAQAVQVLHGHNYCHRDLKPENVLYAPEKVGRGGGNLVTLIDFGLCAKAVTAEGTMLRDFCGSPGFFAPEVLLHDCYDGFKADVWSLGCILLELVLGNKLFSTLWLSMYELSVLKDHDKFRACVKAVLARTREFCHSAEWTYSCKLRNALLGLLSEDPAQRLSVPELLAHAWLSSASPSPSEATSSHGRRPSPTKLKNLAPSACHSSSTVNRLGSEEMAPVRPLSANEDGSASSAGALALSNVALAKVSLPSLSPDKATRCSSEKKNSPNKHVSGLVRG